MQTQTEVQAAIEAIRASHRERRYWMKLQQKIDRALESHIRLNYTEWKPDLEEKERTKINKAVVARLKSIRSGEPNDEGLVNLVTSTDTAREPFDKARKLCEATMVRLAEKLPAHEWIAGVPGAGAIGFATIVAEAGDLSNYANPGKLWKRLGYAPYDNAAGSTWSRTTWRPRALEKEEWIALGYSPQRYALMSQIAKALFFKQSTGHGPYRTLYDQRREHTALTHAEWSDGHSHSDAMRYMFKAFVKDLWQQWRANQSVISTRRVPADADEPRREATNALIPTAPMPPVAKLLQ